MRRRLSVGNCARVDVGPILSTFDDCDRVGGGGPPARLFSRIDYSTADRRLEPSGANQVPTAGVSVRIVTVALKVGGAVGTAIMT